MSEFHKQAAQRMTGEKIDLKMEIDRLKAELENAKLGENFHDQQANTYAQQVAHWIERYDTLRENFQHETKEKAALKAELSEAKAKHESLLKQLESYVAQWKEVKKELTALRSGSEPVAWLGEGGTYVTLSEMKDVFDYVPLYTHPPADKRDEEDAARYRWLRDKSPGQYEHPIAVTQRRSDYGMQYVGPLCGKELDKHIDAARSQE